MIRFQSFLSGSSGNCTYITDDKNKILVDCGAGGKYITECLKRIGVTTGELDGILVSHSHRDHTCGVGILSRKFDIPVYASKGTWEEMSQIVGKISTKNIKEIDESNPLQFGKIKAFPFAIPHDANGALAYRFETEESKMAIATDIGHISDDIFENISGCELVIIEANHDIDMLRNGSYPYYLKKRILSEKGHLSNSDSARLCTMLAKTGTKAFWLGHLSNENNTPEVAFNTVKDAFAKEGINVGTDVELNVLPRFWLEG